MSDTETLDQSLRQPARGEPGRLGLALVWSADEPERVGQIALPATGSVLGRAEGTLGLVQQRPGLNLDTGPLRGGRLSREALRLRPRGERLQVDNLGRRPMIVDGQEVGTAQLGPGDLLEISGAILLYCVERADRLPALGEGLAWPSFPFGAADPYGIVGESPCTWLLRERLAYLAERTSHVLITGPSGTGKEGAARALHQRSSRNARPLISRNAATIPEGLADAELFGNVRNYPNPGMADRPGLVGEADGGMLFLDELGELPSQVQAHLLRVLDQGEYQRLGETRLRRADLRVLAATNRPLEQLKHDVVARFQLRLGLPGLEERREDIPLLLRHMLNGLRREDPGALRRFPAGPDGLPGLAAPLVARLLRRPFSTHVRELHQLLWAALSDAPGPLLALEEGEARPALSLSPERIQEALDRHEGRQEPVWRELGLANRYALGRLIRKHGLRVGRAED